MSDFKLRHIAHRPQLRPTSDDGGEVEHRGEPGVFDGQPAVREGLPADYRMRHDGHYVDHVLRAAPPIRMVPTARLHGGRPCAAQELAALATSIRRFGLLQPLLVRREGGRFDLIDGRRRLQAAVAAGLNEVPCLVHDVDDREAGALREASKIRAGRGEAPAAGEVLGLEPAAALFELTGHLEAISSCLNLFPNHERPLRERLAKELIQAEVQRAARLSQGLAVLYEDRPVTRGAVDLRRLAERVVETMRPERALTSHLVSIEVRGDLPSITGDEQLLAIAIGGALAAMHALVEHVNGATLRCALLDDPARGTVSVRVSQEAVALPASRLSRFFDAGWRERPGGHRAAVGLLAARRIVEMHGGHVEMSASGEVGCALHLELPVRRSA